MFFIFIRYRRQDQKGQFPFRTESERQPAFLPLHLHNRKIIFSRYFTVVFAATLITCAALYCKSANVIL